MKTAVLAVYDWNECYVKELADYISEKHGMPFRVIAFTEKQTLLDYASDNYIDILILSSDCMEDVIEKQDIGKIILLSEEKTMSEKIDYLSIYKYQTTENVIKEVLEYYVDTHSTHDMMCVSEENAEIVGVYSPLGRIGQTTFALMLGQILSEKRSTLYVNMEEFSAFDKIFHKTYAGDLSDLMYFFQQNPETLMVRMQTIVNNLHGMDYIPPLLYSKDLRNIDVEEWINLIKKIAETNVYEVIVLDLSNMVTDVFEMLNICDRIYMPINDEDLSMLKVSTYEEYLLKTEREDIVNRTIKINMPELNKINMDIDYLEEQLWRQMGSFVRNILREAEY